MKPGKQMLSPADVAAVLGVTRARVYQLIHAGEIPATKVGGAIYIPAPAWKRWIARKCEAAMAITSRESREP